MEVSRYLVRGLGCLALVASSLYADYEVPRVEGVKVDGDKSDWADKGLRVEALASDTHRLPALPGLAASLRLAWDERGLLVLLEVEDDFYQEAGDELSLWSGDSVELYLSPAKGSVDIYQLALAPGMESGNAMLRHHVHDRRITVGRGVNALVQAARGRSGGRYTMEVLVPLENIGMQAGKDGRFAFQVAVNDVDASGQRHQVFWYPVPGAYADSEQMHWLRLGKKAGPPVRGVALGAYERFRRVAIEIAAPGDMAGDKVEVRLGKKKLATGRLEREGQQSGARLRLPMPEEEGQYADLRVFVDGKYLSGVVLPDMELARRRALADVELRPESFVFFRDQFPAVDFAQPSLVEDLIGPYQIEVDYYNNEYQSVDTAQGPGRYGAVASVSGADGQVFRRYLTLYRSPEPINLWNPADMDMEVRATLPPQLGIDPVAVEGQAEVIGDYFKMRLAGDFGESENSAVLLASLAGAAAGQRIEPPAEDRDWRYGLQRHLGLAGPYPHLLHLPATYGEDTETKWPLLVFLHGAGERGAVLDLVKQHGPPKLAAAGQDLPFITVSPQCPAGEWWLPARVVDLVDSLSAAYRVDTERIYLTGLSMGGYGTWNIAARYPHKFAAIAPICGGGDPDSVEEFAHLPTWVFHGALDSVVPLQNSQAMVDALHAAGNAARFTIYPEAGHDSWTETYNNPELYRWFMEHTASVVPTE